MDRICGPDLCVHVFYRDQTSAEREKENAGNDGQHCGRRQRADVQRLLSALEVGDIVLTTSGFYGTVIDITDDTVIVEFGNNKNCRIPMQKQAIVQVEKPEQ